MLAQVYDEFKTSMFDTNVICTLSFAHFSPNSTAYEET